MAASVPGACAKVSAPTSERSLQARVPGLQHERRHGGDHEQQDDGHLKDEDLARDPVHAQHGGQTY
jgi:hypothetical protein